MARFMFPRFKAELLRKTIDATLQGETGITAYAFDTGTYAISSVDQFYSDVSAGVVGAGVTMTNVTVSDDGEVDFDNFVFPSLSGATVEGILYTLQHTALGQDLLVYYDDDANFTPVGENVNVTFTGAYVFKL